jgi:hypothetical protein
MEQPFRFDDVAAYDPFQMGQNRDIQQRVIDHLRNNEIAGMLAKHRVAWQLGYVSADSDAA